MATQLFVLHMRCMLANLQMLSHEKSWHGARKVWYPWHANDNAFQVQHKIHAPPVVACNMTLLTGSSLDRTGDPTSSNSSTGGRTSVSTSEKSSASKYAVSRTSGVAHCTAPDPKDAAASPCMSQEKFSAVGPSRLLCD
jgi:hypothetical protein